jgi:hypothetical protein
MTLPFFYRSRSFKWASSAAISILVFRVWVRASFTQVPIDMEPQPYTLEVSEARAWNSYYWDSGSDIRSWT